MDLETIETILKRRGIKYTKESINLGFVIEIAREYLLTVAFCFTGSGELISVEPRLTVDLEGRYDKEK